MGVCVCMFVYVCARARACRALITANVFFFSFLFNKRCSPGHKRSVFKHICPLQISTRVASLAELFLVGIVAALCTSR